MCELHCAMVDLDEYTPKDIQQLIDNGEDVNLKNSFGDTPLKYCCVIGDFDDKRYTFMKILIENCANVNLCDDFNKTPLCIIIMRINSINYQNAKKFIMLLIENGADYNCSDINECKLTNLEKEDLINYINSRNIK